MGNTSFIPERNSSNNCFLVTEYSFSFLISISSISKKLEDIDIRNEKEYSVTRKQLFDELRSGIKEVLPIERSKEHISMLPPDQVEF